MWISGPKNIVDRQSLQAKCLHNSSWVVG